MNGSHGPGADSGGPGGGSGGPGGLRLLFLIKGFLLKGRGV